MAYLRFLVRYMWKVAIGVCAGATLVILHVFDVHPEQALAFAVLGVIADPKTLEALQWASVAFVALATAGIMHFVMWRMELASRTSHLPLGEAAKIAYEKTRHTTAGKIAEGLNLDNVLGYYVHALVGMDDVQIFGSHPPLTVIEKIPASGLQSGTFSEDGSTFTEFHKQTPRYENLTIGKNDLRRYIKQTKGSE